MGRMCKVIMWLCITFIKEKAKCRETQVFAIPGCNATMEWILGQTYTESYAYSLKVFNKNGIEIAQKAAMKCKHVIDSSMYCEVRNTSSKEWRFAVVLFNVTQANSGKYKGELKHGIRNKTITKELKIIDKPQIKVTQKSILHEPFSITCTVNGEFERLIYHWKLNGENLNSSERIDARSANLTFKRLTMVDKLSNFSCRVCSESNCCMESESYAPDPHYLSSVASIPVDNKDLFTVASSLGDKKVATDVPSHHVDNQGQRLELYWMGPSFASVFLLIVGVLILVTLRRIHASREIGQTGSEVSRENLEMHNRPLTIPTVPEHSSRPYRERLNSDNSVSNKPCSEENNCVGTCSVRPSVIGIRFVKMFAKGKGGNTVANNCNNTGSKSQALNISQRENLVPELQEDLYNTVDESSVSVYNSVRDNVIEDTSHEAERSSEHGHYHYAISVELHQHVVAGVNETDQTYITPISDLVRPIEKSQNDESNSHVTNENYITPINNFPIPVNIHQTEDTDLHGADPNYITAINDLADLHGTDPNYITAINDLADLHGTDPNYITAINDLADPIEICPTVETDAHDRGKRRARSI